MYIMAEEDATKMKTTSGNLITRITNAFKMNGYYLRNTDAETAYNVYMSVAAPARSDLSVLRDSLDVFKNSLNGKDKLFGAVNNLLQVIDSAFSFQQIGSIMPNSNLNSEYTADSIFLTIVNHLVLKIEESTTTESYADTIVCSFSALSSPNTVSLVSAIVNDINAGSAHNNIELAVTNLKASLAEIALSGTIEEQATQLANVIIDGEFIVDSSGGDQVIVRDALINYSNSYLYVTLSSAFGNGDFSAVSATDDNTASGLFGNEPLVETNFLGKNTAAPGTLSGAHKVYNSAIRGCDWYHSNRPNDSSYFYNVYKYKK
jgi:hypothetical protein